ESQRARARSGARAARCAGGPPARRRLDVSGGGERGPARGRRALARDRGLAGRARGSEAAALCPPARVELRAAGGRARAGRLGDDAAADPRGLALWIALDNVRKGAALTAVQIAEVLARDHL